MPPFDTAPFQMTGAIFSSPPHQGTSFEAPRSSLHQRLGAAAEALRWSRRSYRNKSWRYRLKQHLRWPVLAALAPAEALAWFSVVRSTPLNAIASWQPQIALKPMQAYLSVTWSRAQRLSVLTNTYEVLAQSWAPLLMALSREGPFVLASLPEGSAVVTIDQDYQFRKEGELVLSLRTHPSAERIMSMAVSFGKSSMGSRVCYIGALQGSPNGLECIRAATKAAHGLRPKMLLLVAVQLVARELRATELLGISNAFHPFQTRYLLSLGRRRRIACDYDEFWAELRATRRADGWYSLPLVCPRRSPDSITARKRAAYARRYRLMDSLAAQIRENVSNRVVA
jgi:uncharacterized protein